MVNQLSGTALTTFFSLMVTNFAHFHPIGVVLVAILVILNLLVRRWLRTAQGAWQ